MKLLVDGLGEWFYKPFPETRAAALLATDELAPETGDEIWT